MHAASDQAMMLNAASEGSCPDGKPSHLIGEFLDYRKLLLTGPMHFQGTAFQPNVDSSHDIDLVAI
jgi:hypothetical protein